MLVAQVDARRRASDVPRHRAATTATAPRRPSASALATANVVVIAGGVSVGKFDLVPAILEEQGVAIHFRQVRMKPGKPLLFGTKGDTLVFGLPGNPVASFVCFELFVRPALRVLAGHANTAPVRDIAAARGGLRGDERPADVSPREARSRRRGLRGAAAAVARCVGPPRPATGRRAAGACARRDAPGRGQPVSVVMLN